jgi:alcohol dehydrogenase YqhD (iron-dependent ADH family)
MGSTLMIAVTEDFWASIWKCGGGSGVDGTKIQANANTEVMRWNCLQGSKSCSYPFCAILIILFKKGCPSRYR